MAHQLNRKKCRINYKLVNSAWEQPPLTTFPVNFVTFYHPAASSLWPTLSAVLRKVKIMQMIKLFNDAEVR